MAQNFFSFSLHERTQDAFVAWLCSCYNEPATSCLHNVAEEFIKDLLGVKRPGVIVNFQSVEVETQIYDIDILLTLKNVNNSGNNNYVVIEDKTNSKIHDNQLVTYIRNLIKKKKTSEDHIYVVYYKTGHIAETPDCIKLVNPVTCQYDFDPNVKSEHKEVISVKKSTYPNLAGMKICDLDDIHNFFCSNPLISRCGCFILDDYADHIDAEYKQYNSGVIDAENGRTESQWGKIFDDSITRNESKYPDLLFKLAFTGSYWEIYVTKKLTGTGVQTCTDPILNVRSAIFEGVRFTSKNPKIYFFVYDKLTTIPALKTHLKSATYDIPTYNPTFYHGKLTSSNYLKSNISEKDIEDLLDAICEEYDRVCSSGFKVAFSLL